jgi:hypothetical protein
MLRAAILREEIRLFKAEIGVFDPLSREVA